MNTKLKFAIPVLALCIIAGIVFWLVPRDGDKGDAESQVLRQSLRQAVEKAKAGDRQQLESIIEGLMKGDNEYVSEMLLPDYIASLKDGDGQVQWLGAQGLCATKSPKGAGALSEYLKAKDFAKLEKLVSTGQVDERQGEWQIQASSAAILALGETRDKSAIPLLESLRSIKDLQFEFGGGPVEQALAKLGANGIRSLSSLGPDADDRQVAQAAQAIRAIHDPKSVPALIATVKDPNCATNIRAAALGSLAAMKDVDTLPLISAAMKEPKYPKLLREAAAENAGRTRRPEAERALLEMIDDPNCDIRVACLYGLAKLNSDKYVPKILEVVLNKSAPLAERTELSGKITHAMQPKELTPHAEMLRMGIKAVKEDDSPADDIRVDMWMALNKATGEELPLELKDDKTAYMWLLEDFQTRFMREDVHASFAETRRKVDEKIKSIVVKWQPEKGGKKP